MRSHRSFFLLVCCFVLSGLASLIYETAWTQELVLIFGASEPAVAAVLAAYMAGLMCGAGLGQWLLGRFRQTLWLYAFLELGIAVSALLVPTALAGVNRLQVALFGGASTPPSAESLGLVLFDLVAAFIVLLPATAMMGATLPLLARHAIRRQDEIGSRIGVLYTANTLGAAAGTLLAAFVLLPSLGLGRTVLVAVAVNGLVFICAALLARRDRPPEPSVELVADPPSDGSGDAKAGDGWIILPLILVSGFVALSYEVLWTRLLSHLLGGSLYAFATMLATFLAGIALGSAGASPLARDPATARRGFVVAQIGVAAAFLGAFVLVDELPGWLEWSAHRGTASLLGGVALTAFTLLPGALFLGASFPFAVRVLTRRARDAGRSSARVFAWNTCGAILGAVVTGFVLLPALRFAGTVRATVAISLVTAVVAALAPQPRHRVLAAVAIAGLVLVVWSPLPTPWQVLRTSPFSGRPIEGDVAYYGVGQSATVLVLDRGVDRRLTANGLPESSIQAPGARAARFTVAQWLALLPHLGHEDVRSTLIIGLGAGVTLAAVPPTVSEVDVIELESEVVRANRVLAGARDEDPLADPRLRLHLNDARSALLLSERRFDAIVSQPSHPWTAGASHLFTSEFFALVRERLEPGGVFVQWIGLAFVDEALLRSLVATLVDAFPHVEVFHPPPGGAVLFLAGLEPLRVEERAARALAEHRRSWEALGSFVPEDLLRARVLDEDGCRRFALSAPLNTDHRNLLQTRSPRILTEPLGMEGAWRALADDDPLRRLAEEQKLYEIRRLLNEKAVIRARHLAAELADPVRRKIAAALIDLVAGRRRVAAQALWRSLDSDQDDSDQDGSDQNGGDQDGNREALGALVQLNRQSLLRSTASSALSSRLGEDPVAELVVEGWRLAASDPAEVAELEPRLAAVDPRHSLFTASRRLRIAWRQVSGDPRRASEALELLDSLLAIGGVGERELLQRAILGARAEAPDVVRASLYELQMLMDRKPRAARIRDQALAVLDLLPEDVKAEAWVERLRWELSRSGNIKK